MVLLMMAMVAAVGVLSDPLIFDDALEASRSVNVRNVQSKYANIFVPFLQNISFIGMCIQYHFIIIFILFANFYWFFRSRFPRTSP